MSLRPPIKTLSDVPHHRPGSRAKMPLYQNCQIETPEAVVRKVWSLIHKRRPVVGAVLDLGAGDGRFSKYGNYSRYVGYEIDPTRIHSLPNAKNAVVVRGCVLDAPGDFDVAVGNPPYIRHQDLSPTWVQRARSLIQDEMGVTPSGLSNLYSYFMWLSLLRTREGGIIGMVVPFGWTYRPASKELRTFLYSKGWDVSVYRLPKTLEFSKDVDPSPSITIIDKSGTSPGVKIRRLTQDLTIDKRYGGRTVRRPLFPYDRKRGAAYAQRGLSTGSQDVFLLTEQARRDEAIPSSSVVPCVATLRPLPSNLNRLDTAAFNRYYVLNGERCWLLRTDVQEIHSSVMSHLEASPPAVRKNTTCRSRMPWYSYRLPSPPKILYASAFSRTRWPKAVVNAIDAVNVGSVHGIYVTTRGVSPMRLLRRLQETDLRKGTVALDFGMRKIEVAQMNGLLKRVGLESLRSVA